MESGSQTVVTAAPLADKALDRIDWKTRLPILGLHVAAAVGFMFTEFSWKGVLLCAVMYYFRMWALSSFFHRYFSHRSFKTSRWFQFIMAFLGTLTAQNGVLWWAANHRHHHRYADKPEDLHSPKQRGFWHAHMGWVLTYRVNRTNFELVRDFLKFPEIRWLDRYWLFVVAAFAATILAIGGWFAFYWCFLLSTVLLLHGTFTVNSLAHMWGSRRYETGDTSRNNFFIALLTMGEGWHNNHHRYMGSARQGFFWWEFDPSYYVLKILEKFRLIWDLRGPPEEARIRVKR